MRIVHATRAHALDLGSRLRPIDKQEVMDVLGMHPVTGTLYSLDCSETAYAAFDGPRLFALYGCAPSAKRDDTGCPWMLGSDDLKCHRKELLTVALKAFASMHKTYPRLENYVSVENVAARRWLMWAGFEMVEHVQFYGEGRRPFIRFVKECKPCAL